jgi:hypothetical protein
MGHFRFTPLLDVGMLIQLVLPDKTFPSVLGNSDNVPNKLGHTLVAISV